MVDRSNGERRKPLISHIVMIFTLILQFAGIVWGASNLNAKVEFVITRLDRVERKVDQMSEDITTLKTDVAVLKTDVANLKSLSRR